MVFPRNCYLLLLVFLLILADCAVNQIQICQRSNPTDLCSFLYPFCIMWHWITTSILFLHIGKHLYGTVTWRTLPMLVQASTSLRFKQNGGWFFFFLKQRFSRKLKQYLFLFFTAECKRITLAVWAVFQVVDDHQGFLAVKEEPWLAPGEARGVGGGHGGAGTCAWPGKAPPRRSASRWAGLPSLREGQGTHTLRQRPQAGPAPAHHCQEGLGTNPLPEGFKSGMEEERVLRNTRKGFAEWVARKLIFLE